MADLAPEHIFIKKAFLEFYSKTLPPQPFRFTLREYAYFPFGLNMMRRHIVVRNRREYRDLFIRNVPRHIYYSSAFYRHPDRQPMEEKVRGWLGAELIFDLDSDHIPGAEEMPYPQQLKVVKKYFIRLVDEFIIPDFGLDEDHILINFSGGRGYHLHVTDPKVFSFDSHQRREIVDYITGKGIEPESLLRVKKKRIGRGAFEKEVDVYYLPPKNSWGWAGRLWGAMEELFGNLERMDKSEAVNTLHDIVKNAQIGWGRRRAERLYEMLFTSPASTKRRKKMLEEGVLDLLPNQYRRGLLHILKVYSAVNLSGETDEPVTTDTRRLIRVPGSLHGKSTLQATPLKLEDLDTFDPLTEAVVLPEKPEVVIKTTGRGTITLKDVKENFEGDEELSLPFYAAAFLIGRRSAVLVSR